MDKDPEVREDSAQRGGVSARDVEPRIVQSSGSQVTYGPVAFYLIRKEFHPLSELLRLLVLSLKPYYFWYITASGIRETKLHIVDSTYVADFATYLLFTKMHTF